MMIKSDLYLWPFQGRIQGEFVGFGRTPSETKKFFWSKSCREGAEFGEVNCLGWHEKGGWVVETGLEELSLKRVCI